MTAERNFMAELLHRRVPQLVGMYVAATWMMVEIGDWASERFGLSDGFTSILFVTLAVMLPSVILVSWNHGAPGRDRWTGLEKIFIPANLVVAVFVVRGLAPAMAPDAAVETQVAAAALVTERMMVDETGAETIVEVPAIDYFERVASFPWVTDDPDAATWLAYALPLLLERDIDRGLFLGLSTLYDLTNADELRSMGFASGRDLPRALRLRMAQESGISYLVEGRFTRSDAQVTLSATMIDVASNVEVARFDTTGPDLLAAIDEIAARIAAAATPDVPDDQRMRTDLAIAEHFSASLPAIELYVEATRAQFFENDYPRAIELLTAATVEDPSFAVAFATLSNVYRASAQPADALAAVDQALALDYKLSSEQRFVLKANRYAISGEIDKALRVLEMMTEVHPNSIYAHQLLGSNYMLLDRIEEAEQAFLRVRTLNPSEEGVLLTLSDISRMHGDFPRAETFIREYLDGNADDADAVRKLASLQETTGQIDAARETYERSGFLDSDSFDSELALAKLEMWQAEFDAAIDRLQRLEAAGIEPGQRVQIGFTRLQLFQLRGQVSDALAELEQITGPAQRTMSPIQQIFTIVTQGAVMKATIGRHEEALAEVEAAASQMQPPINGFFNFARLSVHQETENVVAFRAAIEEATAFVEQYQFPTLAPFIAASGARLAVLEGRPEEAVAQTREAMAAFRRSFVSLVEPYTADYLQIQLASALRQTGELEDARSVIEGHLRRYPADGNARLEYIRVLKDVGDLAGARAEADTLARLWGEADEAYIGLIRLARLSDDLSAAL